MTTFPPRLVLAERLTLAVLLCGVASLALSDFVSPLYWGLVVAMAALRLWLGPRFSLSEMQASLIGWSGLLWVGIELAMGRALVVAFTDFLLILSLAIVVEAATPRNHLHRMLVGFFLILGAAVLTDSVLYLLPLSAFIIFVWRAAHCLYGMQLPGGDLQMGRWRSDTSSMLLLAIGAAILFMALPRFDFHSYLKPVQPRKETSGFSNQVQLGDFARSLDTTVIMRIEALGPEKEAFRKRMGGRYWRGVVLDKFNGRGWEQTPEPQAHYWIKGSDISLLPSGQGEPFAVYRDSSDHGYLLVPNGLGKIVDIPDSIRANDQGVFSFDRPPDRRLRIVMRLGEGSAQLHLLRGPNETETDQSAIPEGVKRWADSVVGNASEPGVVAGKLFTELKSWEYDLNAPIDDQHPVTSFLEIRSGHCELYATALALALRYRGVPARVVNGYFGGEWNDVGGFYLIRQQHAHSWVEAWIDGRWQRFDATPASRWLLSGVRFPALDEVWESIKLSWYRYVLEFQNSDRTEAIATLFAWLKRWSLWLLALAGAVAGLAWLLRRGIRLPAYIWRRGVANRLDRWLRQRGIERLPHQPVRHLSPPQGVAAHLWQQFVRDWEMQAYRNGKGWSVRELNRHLRAL